MNQHEILTNIKQSGLGGRGGADFPVWQKWKAVKNSLEKTKNSQAYLVINAAEGEPNSIKDAHILANHQAEIIKGLKLALEYFGAPKITKIYFFIRHDYYQKQKSSWKKILQQSGNAVIKNKLVVFIKPDHHDYLAGEETALLNIIEGEAAKPRLKPPFPGSHGLFSKPTLLHNVETWQALGLIADKQYQNKRFYYLSGQIAKPGLYYLADNLSIAKILKNTSNWPDFPFFVQIGGDACGRVKNYQQLNTSVTGSGTITVYPLNNQQAQEFLIRILRFHHQQSCGQCVPCREGTYRLLEMLETNNFNEENWRDLVFALQQSSFCAFGSSLSQVLLDYQKNLQVAWPPDLKFS